MLIPLPENPDAKTCYNYALNILGERLPKEYEDIIKTNAYYAYCYAKNVIKGRWIEGEEVIRNDALYAYLYSCNLYYSR